MDLLLKIVFAFLVQSNVFFWYLHKKKEENLFIWNIYFVTNTLAAIVTLCIGHMVGLYFPIYLFFLLCIYYVFYIVYLHEQKELRVIMTYFSLNLYVIFFIHLIFSFSIYPPYLIFLVSSVFLTILLIRHRLLLGIYILPILWYLSMLVSTPYLLSSMFEAISHKFLMNQYVFGQLVALIIIGALVIAEVLFFKFSQEDASDKGYSRILKNRTKSAFKVMRVGI